MYEKLSNLIGTHVQILSEKNNLRVIGILEEILTEEYTYRVSFTYQLNLAEIYFNLSDIIKITRYKINKNNYLSTIIIKG